MSKVYFANFLCIKLHARGIEGYCLSKWYRSGNIAVEDFAIWYLHADKLWKNLPVTFQLISSNSSFRFRVPRSKLFLNIGTLPQNDSSRGCIGDSFCNITCQRKCEASKSISNFQNWRFRLSFLILAFRYHNYQLWSIYNEIPVINEYLNRYMLLRSNQRVCGC